MTMLWRKLKKIVGPIDDKIFGGRIRHYYMYGSSARLIADIFSERPLRKHRKDFYGFGFDSEYHDSTNSYINRLCDKYGTDKGGARPGRALSVHAYPHNYADLYDMLFRLHRNNVRVVLEFGVAGGASLKMWRDYFPKAQIIGADIDESLLFSDRRIKTFACDQTSEKSISKFIKNAKLKTKSVDIIIDDGLHEFHAGVSLFQGLSRLLTDRGFYIIEDVMPEDYKAYKDYFSKIGPKFNVLFINLRRPKLRIWLNRLIIITRNA